MFFNGHDYHLDGLSLSKFDHLCDDETLTSRKKNNLRDVSQYNECMIFIIVITIS